MGLRAYERTTIIQEQAVSKTLNDPSSTFVEAKESLTSHKTKQLEGKGVEKPNIEKVSCENSTEKIPMISGTLNNCVLNFYCK